MKTTLALVGLVLLALTSCKIRQPNGVEHIEQASPAADFCISPELCRCLSSYVKQTKGRFFFDDEIYFSAYFFERGNVRYFTLWTWLYPAHVVLEDDIDDPSSYKNDYAYLRLEGYDVGLASPKGYDTKLYNSSCSSFFSMSGRIKREGPEVYYDGSWYPKTYRYDLRGGQWMIAESDTTIVDFIDGYSLEYHEKYP